MAQHDYDIANQAGAGFRSDINNALAAIVSNNSGATEPATMFAYQFWADTTTGLLKQRNAGNTAWVTIGTMATINLGLLAQANTWTADQTISTTDPQLILIETDGAADNKRWDLRANGEALSLRAVNDADSVATDIITVQRTGTTVDNLTIPCTFASTKAAASGYARVTPNMCRATDFGTAPAGALVRDTLTLITGPTGCKGLILYLSNNCKSNNATGDRNSQTVVYSDSGGTIGIASNAAIAREQVAVAAGTTLVSKSGEVHVKTNSSGEVWVQFTDDAGNQGSAAYIVIGYYD